MVVSRRKLTTEFLIREKKKNNILTLQSNLFKLFKDQIFDPKEQSGISSNKLKDVEKSNLLIWWCSRN